MSPTASSSNVNVSPFTVALPDLMRRDTNREAEGIEGVEYGGIPPQPTIRGFGSVVSSPSGARAEFRLKTILVLSNRDRMPLVAHFTHFESDTEGIGNTTELCIIDFVRLRNELTKSYCRKTNGARASVSHSWQCQWPFAAHQRKR